jgi:predicted O-methyltransferase YrrM
VHTRLIELTDYLDREQRELSATLRNIPEDHRREAPARGRWSVVDVIEHLSIVEARMAVRFANWIAEARAAGVPAETDESPILPSINTARLLDRSARFVAPEVAHPTSQMTFDAAWQSLKGARAEVKRVIATADGLALGQIVHPHAVLGPMTMYEWFAFVGGHTARHTAQIVEIGATVAGRRRWAAVDDYIGECIVPSDAALDAALASSVAAQLPSIQVTATHGKMLQIFARMVNARSVLEIGTLGGYSTIWLARALPEGGRLITLEIDPKHADVARANIARANLSHVVEIKLGRAVDTLPHLTGPFDLVFIDADKPSNPDYFKWAVKLTHPGSVIIVDNVVRDGEVVNADTKDPQVIGVRELNDVIANEPSVTATTIQTVGGKGYDGFTIAIRN